MSSNAEDMGINSRLIILQNDVKFYLRETYTMEGFVQFHVCIRIKKDEKQQQFRLNEVGTTNG